ncbi:hypothetical protein [Mycolicibacterium sphagni]|uniref:Uncharacterized protein n=1 Tax=Mycolicibacterium sphagni TaxID=1786 RepID=A0ABX2JT93_9MYCO|nr:hypothetical protein [Mycolicibacterium sphagni]NTY58727.1 hypothetical protein [Mycolicibacterium sphagni]
MWQIKRYPDNLTATEKRAIRRSFDRVVATSQKEGWQISDWHLVMPLDLTNQNLGWLDTHTSSAGFDCETHGLLWCDTQAAKYPKVIDYYLRDGRERLQALMNDLTALLSGREHRQEDEPLVPGDVVGDLAAIHRSLNACDPFYRYDFAASDGPPPDAPAPGDRGLVAVCAMQHDTVWVSVKIFALSLAALEERPIKAQFQLNVPDGDDELRQQVQQFIDYGTPLSLPQGSVSGSLDLPAGLGGSIDQASLRIVPLPSAEVDTEQAELYLAILAPDSDTEVAGVRLMRTEHTAGQAGGLRTLWSDSSGILNIEILGKGSDIKMGFRVHYDLPGRLPADVVEILRVLGAAHPPNRLGFRRTWGPPQLSVVGDAPFPEDSDAELWAVIADALMRLQDHVALLRLRMPEQMTEKQGGDIIEAAKLMSGEALSGPLSGAFNIHHIEDDKSSPFKFEVDGVYEILSIKDIEIELDNNVIPIGKETLFFLAKCVDTGDETSRVEPISDGTSMRYTGDIETGRVLGRPPKLFVRVSDDVGPSPPAEAGPT